MQQSSNNETLILEVLLDSKKYYRAHPREDFISNLAVVLSATYSPKEIKILMDKAAREFDHYPSLSQLEKLAQYINVKELANPKPKVQYYEKPNQGRTPWPPSLEGLMLLIEKNLKTGVSTGFEFGCRFCKVSSDEAFRLYDLYVERRYKDPLVEEVLARKRPAALSEQLNEAFAGR